MVLKQSIIYSNQIYFESIGYTVKNNVSYSRVVVLSVKNASLHISLSNTICDYFNIH